MTTAVLCKGVTAVQAAPANGALPSGSQAVSPQASNDNVANAQNLAFQVVVTCTSGNCSASVQIMVSNDNVNWTALGSAIAVSSGASPNSAINAETLSPYEWITAYVTAISGTGASVQCILAT